MESKQYRITRIGKQYIVRVTWGFMDVRLVGAALKQAEARTLAKNHATRNSVSPIILT